MDHLCFETYKNRDVDLNDSTTSTKAVSGRDGSSVVDAYTLERATRSEAVHR